MIAASMFIVFNISYIAMNRRFVLIASNKEVAAVRFTSEQTVRKQAKSVYSKAGLTGRAALSAFFLEDLLAPIEGLDTESESP